MNIREINEIKNKSKYKKYDPISGLNCNGKRIKLIITDAPNPKMTTLYLPESMAELTVVKDLIRFKSIRAIYDYFGEEYTYQEMVNFWYNFCDLRQYHDVEYYFYTLVTIRDKITSADINFKLNLGQRVLIEKLEKMRLANMPIRLILLKARQWGGSTCIQMYMNWIQLFHRRNWNSVIAAHKKDASITIRSMMDKTINKMPMVSSVKYTMKPFAGTQNIKQIPERGCTVTVGTAVEPDSVRSQDAKMAHLSEIAFFPNTPNQKTSDLVNSIIGSVPRVPLSVIIYESTANGIGDFFFNECQRAINGETVFEFLFVAWFLIDIYEEKIDTHYYNHNGKLVEGNIDDFINTLNDYEKNLFTNHSFCTLENLNWYRAKCSEMTSHADMKQEYPSDEKEAFQDSGTPIFRADDIESMRKYCKPPIAVGIVEGNKPRNATRLDDVSKKDILQGIHFIPAADNILEASKSRDLKVHNQQLNCILKIWEFPDTSIEVDNDRYVTVVDTGGRSKNADWSVITVFDRFYMIDGGVPEVVAEWRGHIDHDLLIWLAAQISEYFNKAHLVIESNTHETEYAKVDGQSAEYILTVISDYYDNLYIREGKVEDLKMQPAKKIGFHMNVSTKTKLINHFVTMLRDIGYYERDHGTLDEARYYQKGKTALAEAMQGKNDDKLITRLIGTYICYSLSLPTIRTEKSKVYSKKVIGASSF